MAVTMLSVLNLARIDLNDAKGTDGSARTLDSKLIQFANDGIAKTVVMRPDLNFGKYTTAYADLTTASNFPLPLEYRPAIANYIVMRTEAGDDPFAVEQRALQSLKIYLNDLGLG